MKVDDLSCPPIPGLDRYLKAGEVVLLGEIHGTKEGPAYIEHIVCHALKKELSVTVGLEIPQADQSVINAFLQSNGSDTDRNKILNLPFWSREYQDGRGSQAMFNLLEAIRKLKSNELQVHVVSIDNEESDDRDLFMAQNVIAEAEKNPSNFFIVLTGNYHSMITEDTGLMGSYVIAQLGKRVLSLKQNYIKGTAWVDVAGEGFGPVGLRGDGRDEVGVFLDKSLEEYHGTLEVVSINYSRPAKELLD